jgi:hypothetical protein
MATLSTTLTLASTDATSDTLKVSAVDTLTVTNPAVNAARASISTSAATNILTASGNTSITYVYIKNANSDASHILTLKDDAGNSFADLAGGEFAFLPVKGATGLECQASGADIVAEYGYWTKG